MKKRFILRLCVTTLAMSASGAWAKCSDVSNDQIKSAYDAAASAVTGGYQLPAGLNMWVTFVDETGMVCKVYTPNNGAASGNSAWLGSRVISAQKAFTANAFSLDGYAISTANLYTAVQADNSLFGLQLSNPVDANLAYQGRPSKYGKFDKDPMTGNRIGGVNVFGGGLAIYKDGTKKIGAIGVSGDTSCRDHAFAWRMRANLGMHPLGNGKNLPKPLNAAATVDSGAGHLFGTGITTYNIDKNGIVESIGNDAHDGLTGAHPLTGAKYGDEMILRSGGSADTYWVENWSHPTCPGSINNIDPGLGGVPVDTTDNGILNPAP